jgi:N-formylglutamate amidohydrolase
MGDPTDPGEDQETTIIIEGPPEDADPQTIASFNATFASFKSEMSGVLKKYHKTLKSRLRKIEYVKKKKDE